VRRSFSPQHLSDRIDLKVALGEQTLQTSVLGLELAQTADLGDLHVAVALAPAVEGALADAVSGADGADRGVRASASRSTWTIWASVNRDFFKVESPLFEETLPIQAVLKSGGGPNGVR